jgi:hypothetical protein
MAKDGRKIVVLLLVVVIMTIFITAILNLSLMGFFNVLFLQITGLNTGNQTGVVNFTQSGAAGIVLIDDAIDFGSGYYNTTCGTDYSILNSLLPFPTGENGPYAAPRCWINTTNFLRNPANKTADYHLLQNNGSSVVNITVLGNKNAKDFICGIGGTCTENKVNVTILVEENETASCSAGLQSSFALFSNDTANLTIGLCNRLSYANEKDELKVFYVVTLPSDISPGVKELLVTYQATAI